MIKYEKLRMKDIKECYQVLFDTFKKELPLTDEQALIAVSIAADVCPFCWKNTRDCQCWNA